LLTEQLAISLCSTKVEKLLIDTPQSVRGLLAQGLIAEKFDKA